MTVALLAAGAKFVVVAVWIVPLLTIGRRRAGCTLTSGPKRGRFGSRRRLTAVVVTVCAMAALALAGGAAGVASSRTVIAFGSERGSAVRIHLLGMTPGYQQVLESQGFGMDVEPSWSPNGRKLAIATSDASGQNFDIAVLDANGAGRRRITSGASWDEEPAWSPNGNRIAFASDRNGNFNIYTVRPDGSGLRQLTNSPCEDTEPSWSPDGSKIVFTSRRGGFPHLWTMNADGSDERKLLAANAWSPAWSPDGATIAFVSDQDGDDEIYTVDGDGQNTMKLTDNQGIADDAPSWSPDSTIIAFTSNRAGDGNIFSMRTNGSGVHTLVGGVWTNSDPAWRP